MFLNQILLLRVVTQLNKETVDFSSDMWTIVWMLSLDAGHFLAFICLLYNYYSIVFAHFGLCSNSFCPSSTFEMQLSFNVWGSWIRPSPFASIKTILNKLVLIKTK